MGDRGDDQLVGAGGLLQLLELVGDLARGTGELGVHPVGDQFAVGVAPDVGAGLVRGRERDRALAGADAADPQAVAGGEFPGGGLVVGDHHVGGNAHVGAVQVGRGTEGGAVALDRLDHGRGADVVVGGEPQAVPAGDLGAFPAAAA